ncbi:MAG: type II toxin-antitoxin system HicB family antitoxin [Nitrosopumilus sp.]|nr:type II toxin-antitoxin system HicB family antitoxin [Nitrosopumilus sp.]
MMISESTLLEAVIGKKQGRYYAIVRDLPSCVADGATMEEAIKHIKEVAALSLIDIHEAGLTYAPREESEHRAIGTYFGSDDFRKRGIEVIRTQKIKV